MLHKEKGFTLVEVLLVVAIIGLLAAIAIPRFQQTTNDAKTETCNSNIANFNAIIEADYAENGAYPTIDTGAGELLNTSTTSNAWFPGTGAPTCPYTTAYDDADPVDNRVDAHSH